MAPHPVRGPLSEGPAPLLSYLFGTHFTPEERCGLRRFTGCCRAGAGSLLGGLATVIVKPHRWQEYTRPSLIAVGSSATWHAGHSFGG
jgi:hypothetical protein